VPSKQGTDLLMNFGTVLMIQKNDKNVAAAILEKGLARTSIYKDNMSRYLDDILSAEKKAVEQKLCLHSKKEPPQ